MKYTPKSTPWDKDRTKLKGTLAFLVTIALMIGLSYSIVYVLTAPDPTEFDWQVPAEYVEAVDEDNHYKVYCDDNPPIRVAIGNTSYDLMYMTPGKHTCYMTVVVDGVESAPSNRITFYTYAPGDEYTATWVPYED